MAESAYPWSKVQSKQFRLGARLLELNLLGIGHEESLVAPPGGGNCINWILGHLVVARVEALALLGREPRIAAGSLGRYGMGQLPLERPGEATPLGELSEAFQDLQDPLLDAIRSAGPEVLARHVPNSPTGNSKETVASRVVGIAFHEAYHLGQIGILRRMLGKERAIP